MLLNMGEVARQIESFSILGIKDKFHITLPSLRGTYQLQEDLDLQSTKFSVEHSEEE
jgi:hypothetical protein